MVKAIAIPEGDRFQIITEHEADLIYDPAYLDIQRTDGIVIIEITLASGRTVEQKKALFRNIAELLAAEHSVRKEDVFISLVEIARENWSFRRAIFATDLRPCREYWNAQKRKNRYRYRNAR